MAANTSPIFPLAPAAFFADFTAKSACTTRAPTVTASLAGANIFVLVPAGASQSPASTAGTRIDRLQVEGASNSITAPTAAQVVGIWWWDGTTAYLWDELLISVTTPSTSSAAFQITKNYTNLVLPVGHALYASTTIATTASTTAFTISANGGTY
jgi:hypothetical protein